jgi:hypothetical protein
MKDDPSERLTDLTPPTRPTTSHLMATRTIAVR